MFQIHYLNKISQQGTALWTEDGWFTVNEGKGPSLTQIAPDLPECIYERNLFDDFNDTRLNLEWEFYSN